MNLYGNQNNITLFSIYLLVITYINPYGNQNSSSCLIPRYLLIYIYPYRNHNVLTLLSESMITITYINPYGNQNTYSVAHNSFNVITYINLYGNHNENTISLWCLKLSLISIRMGIKIIEIQ